MKKKEKKEKKEWDLAGLRLEESIIGALLLNDREADDVITLLPVDTFKNMHTKIWYSGVIELRSKKLAIDNVLLWVVAEKLLAKEDKTLPKVAEMHLYEMANNVPSAKNVLSYAKALLDMRKPEVNHEQNQRVAEE